MMQPNIYEAIKDSDAFEDPNNELSKRQQETSSSQKMNNSTKSIVSSWQQDILQTAANLTHVGIDRFDRYSTDFSVSQVGIYQFWRDLNTIAVVDVNNKSLIAYGETGRDFFIVPFKELDFPHIQAPDNLLSKIHQFDPNTKFVYDTKATLKAYKTIVPLDPLLRHERVRSQENKLFSIVNNSQAALEKFIKQYSLDKLKEHIYDKFINFKRHSQAIAATLIGDKVVQKAYQRFSKAYSKTGEDTYRIGNCYLEKRRSSFELYDSQNRLIVKFSKQEQGLLLQQVDRNVNKLKETLDLLKNPNIQVIGSQRLKAEYESKVNNLIEKLSQYKQGTHIFEESNTYLVKKKIVSYYVLEMELI